MLRSSSACIVPSYKLAWNVDRILKGEKPGELPVKEPIKGAEIPPAGFLPFDSSSGSGRVTGHTVQQGRNIGRREGFAEQISLPFIASIGFQICQLLGVFDTFGGSRQAKCLCKAEDSADNQ